MVLKSLLRVTGLLDPEEVIACCRQMLLKSLLRVTSLLGVVDQAARLGWINS